MKTEPLYLGTETVWGTIEAIGLLHGERYYWMIDKHRCVSMIPGFVVEKSLHKATEMCIISTEGKL